jgi:heme-degrading monooxygenase HmoA
LKVFKALPINLTRRSLGSAKKEVAMSVKIFIERQFKEGFSAELLPLLNKIRVKAMEQNGYIRGETLVNLENRKEVLVIPVWSSLDNWKAWLNSQERGELENELSTHMEVPPKIRPFMLGADAIKQVFEQVIHDTDVET